VNALYKQILGAYPGGASIIGFATVKKHGEKPMEKQTMTFDPTKMREERASLSRKMTEMVNSTPSDQWDTAKQREFNDTEAAIMAIDGQLDKYERALIAAGERLRGGAPVGGSKVDLNTSIRALGEFAKTGDRFEFGVQNSMTESGDAGVVVPHELYNEILRVAEKFSPLRPLCRVIPIGTTASKFTFPVSTSGATGSWVGETDSRAETTAPTLDSVSFNDAEIFFNLPITQWLEEDTAIGQFLVEEIAAGIGRAEGKAVLSGSGTKQPQGVLTATMSTDADGTRTFGSLQTISTGNASSITADSLISLLYSLAPEYRMNCTWVLNSSTLAAVRTMKDSNGQYLWQQSLAPGQPATLLGYPICEANDMPDIAADAYPVIVGDWQRGYSILDRAMTVLRDPYSNKPYINIYSRKRVSGAVVDSCALKVLKVAA